MRKNIPLIIIVLVCVLSFLMFGCGFLFDENVVPDTRLRSKIGRHLYNDFDARITAVDMRLLTELDATPGILGGSRIYNLTGLEYAENLRVLNLGGNRIVNVSPLAGLNKLIELSLGGNRIVDVSPLEGLKNLQWLFLNNNDIVDVNPLAGLKNLQKLDLTNNPLSDDSKNLIIPIIEANGTEVLY